MHPFDWTVEKTRHIIQDEWVSLRSDDCVMPDGTSVAPFYVLEYMDWVSIFALTDKDEVVMVRQYRHGVSETILELPCGRVDDTDSSPLETAHRELAEETGFTVETMIPSGLMYANASSHNNKNYSFAATGAGPNNKQVLDDYEQIEVVLVPVSELLAMMRGDPIFPTSQHSCVYNGLMALGRLSVD
jgi:8-oxo-dGTP pyrophosphatase MutT (NUDIX family)